MKIIEIIEKYSEKIVDGIIEYIGFLCSLSITLIFVIQILRYLFS